MSASASGSPRTDSVSSSWGQVLGVDENRRVVSVACDGDALVVMLDPVDDLVQAAAEAVDRLPGHGGKCATAKIDGTPTTTVSDSCAAATRMPPASPGAGDVLPPCPRSRGSRSFVKESCMLIRCASTLDRVEIHRSAHRHGVAVDDIRHALRHPEAVVEDDEGVSMVLGPDRAGRLLEIGVVDLDEPEATVIHAMSMRRKYEQFQ